MSDTLADLHCPNCGAVAERAYCPECGQAQREYHRSLGALAAEALDAFAGWDGKLPATIRLLLARPGALTAEFLAGRRARYVPPLRLYLTASVALLLALQTPSRSSEGIVRVWHGPRQTGYTQSPPARLSPLPAQPGEWTFFHMRWIGGGFGMSAANVEQPTPGDNWLNARVQRGLRTRFLELRALPAAQATAALRRSFFASIGTTLFLLVPVLALVCMLLWRRARLFYAEHLVFALHTQAQLLIATAVLHFTLGWASAVPVAWAVGYLALATRRVYGTGRERRATTVGKTALLVVVYGVVAAAGMVGTLFVALLAAG